MHGAVLWSIERIVSVVFLQSDANCVSFLDIKLQEVAILTNNNANSTLEYLRLTRAYRSFSISILQILIEEWHVSHVKRINNKWIVINYKVGYYVMTCTEVQSDAKKGCVGKLSCQISEPFRIVFHTGHRSYFVQRLSNPRSYKINCMAENLYTLPPSLLPWDLVDGCDSRYLKKFRQPVTNPLKKSLDILLYNDTYWALLLYYLSLIIL